MIFPQGQLVPDEITRRHEFKSGTMAIAKICARRRKEPIWIVRRSECITRPIPQKQPSSRKPVQGLGFKGFAIYLGSKIMVPLQWLEDPFKAIPKTTDIEEIDGAGARRRRRKSYRHMYVKRLPFCKGQPKTKLTQARLNPDQRTHWSFRIPTWHRVS